MISPCASDRIQTHDLWMMSQLFYHCAAGAQQASNSSLFTELKAFCAPAAQW